MEKSKPAYHNLRPAVTASCFSGSDLVSKISLKNTRLTTFIAEIQRWLNFIHKDADKIFRSPGLCYRWLNLFTGSFIQINNWK